ncbi:MAG: hypothetical protein ACFFAS_18765 [Promethearchaeota archaeon]
MFEPIEDTMHMSKYSKIIIMLIASIVSCVILFLFVVPIIQDHLSFWQGFGFAILCLLVFSIFYGLFFLSTRIKIVYKK